MFLSDVMKTDLFRLYYAAQRDTSVLVLENAFSTYAHFSS